MSITSCVEVRGRTGSRDQKYVIGSSRKFRLTSDTDLETVANVLNYGSLPAMYSFYPSSTTVRVSSQKCEQMDDPLYWLVTIDYTNKFDFDPATFTENPLLRPEVVKFSYERGEKAVLKDLSGWAIVNSAESLINPPMVIPYGVQIIEITQNRPTLDYTITVDVQDVVNSATWRGLTAGTVIIRGLVVEPKSENDVNFWEYKWTLAVKSLAYDGWTPTKVLDQGFWGYNDDDQYIQFCDAHGHPFSAPSLMKDGYLLPEGEDPEYIDYDLHRTANFSTLIG